MNESKIDQQTCTTLEKKSTQTVGEIFEETSGNELTQVLSEEGKIDETNNDESEPFEFEEVLGKIDETNNDESGPFEFEEVLRNQNISNLRRSERNRKERTMDDYFIYMTQTCSEQNDPTDVEEAMRGHD
ncbi:hypothetical protein JTB14_009610 [Gonioctena quinquepunctata]|nr:hypothetical protein JTB14_009610 [Gonioctena quinquepunctata]